MKLVKIAGRKAMLKVIIADGKEEWANTTKPVYEYAKSHFKEGDEVSLTYEKKEGESLIFVTRIEKPGASSQQNSNSSDETKKCACGADISNPKYSQCYNCAKKKGKQSSSTSYSKDESIEKQNVNNAVSRSLIALQGSVNPNNIVEIASTLWDFYYGKLTK